jgi:hypothetical protein
VVVAVLDSRDQIQFLALSQPQVVALVQIEQVMVATVDRVAEAEPTALLAR